jgi:hypothetical protein
MVKNENEHSGKTRAKQGCPADSPEPYKIGASTPFDFGAKNLTPYGGHTGEDRANHSPFCHFSTCMT